MMKICMRRAAVVLGLLAAFSSGSAAALTVTLAGANVNFTFDSSLTGLFGVPAVSGNVLFFTPTSFKTQSLNGAGFTTASQTFNVLVQTNAGYGISGITYAEDGDYFAIGPGSGVAVGGKIYVRDLDAPLASPLVGKFKTSQPLTSNTTLADFEATDWSAQTELVSPAGWRKQHGVVGSVNVTIENLLLASTRSTSAAAFIEKKFASLDITASPVAVPVGVPVGVPEPATWAMMAAGLALVASVVGGRTRHSR